MFLDATYCTARVNHQIVSQTIVVPGGVAADGSREVHGFDVGDTANLTSTVPMNTVPMTSWPWVKRLLHSVYDQPVAGARSTDPGSARQYPQEPSGRSHQDYRSAARTDNPGG